MNHIKQTAFTLIELLIVVLIIGILASVAIPQYNKLVKKSIYSKMLPLLKTVAMAQKTYFLQHGAYNWYFDKLDIDMQIQGSCPGIGRLMEGYCFEMHSYGNTRCLSITLPAASASRFGLTPEMAGVSGYMYCFEPLDDSAKQVLGAEGPWCWEEGYWPPRKERTDMHCGGKLKHNNWHGAWYEI